MAAETQETYFGRCKCCLKDTYLKNMWFTGKNEHEIFGQMLVDCFSIDWLVKGNIEDDKICEACISKLRVAVDFKQQVLESQNEILQSEQAQFAKGDVKNGESSSSEEEEEEEDEMLDETSQKKSYEDVEFLEEEVLEESNNDDDDDSQVSDSEPVGKKMKWPKNISSSQRYKQFRRYTEEDLEAAAEAVKSKKMTRAKAAETYNVPPKTISRRVYGDDTEKKGLGERFHTKEFVKVIKAILTHTNATPFRMKMSKYSCFFCPWHSSSSFENPDVLREHTHSVHDDKVIEIEFAIRPHHLNQMIRFDILNLSCDCGEVIEWSEMVDHLETAHNVTGVEDACKKIIPYNLTGHPRKEITCAICEFSACFSKLDTHMNKHYQNYICGECGKPFVTNQRLKSHELYHDYGEFRCETCGKVFATMKRKRNHVKGVHEKSLSHICPVCPERFLSDLAKYKHLKTVHHDLLETNGMKCKLCHKAFWPRDYLAHMKQVHSQFQCGTCDKKFGNQNLMIRHVCTLETVKYQCDLCFVMFPTVKEVVAHKELCEKEQK